jgi:hypothetical protein
MPDFKATSTSGVEAKGYREGAASTDAWSQSVVVVPDHIPSFKGRAATFRTPGRAAVSHKIMALHNASGSAVLVDVHKITVDVYFTVAKAVTVPPPILRLSRFTTLPTGGTALAKVPEDTAMTPNANVTAWQDASADGTSATALTITVPAGQAITQEIGPRLITAAGYEVADRMEFLNDTGAITLRALEGVVLEVVSPAGTSEPITDMFIASVQWDEYTRP